MRKPFKPWKKKTSNQRPPSPQDVEGMNFNEYAMGNWCRAHNSHHSDKSCLEFINMYNDFLPPPIESKKKKEKEEVEEEDEEVE